MKISSSVFISRKIWCQRKQKVTQAHRWFRKKKSRTVFSFLLFFWKLDWCSCAIATSVFNAIISTLHNRWTSPDMKKNLQIFVVVISILWIRYTHCIGNSKNNNFVHTGSGGGVDYVQYFSFCFYRSAGQLANYLWQQSKKYLAQ